MEQSPANLKRAALLEETVRPAQKPSLAHHGLLIWLQKHWAGAALVVVLLVAVVVRLLVLAQSRFIGDGDEAITGVMAKHIMEGERPVFTYGLTYMAPTEAYFTALLYALFGVQSWLMKVAPFLASLAFVALNYAVARRFVASKLAGVFAAALTALPSLYFVVTSLRAWNHFIETLVLGNLLLLVACALIWPDEAAPGVPRWWGYTRREWLLWAVLGGLAGLSFYGYLLIIYYHFPIVVFLFFKDKLFPFRRTGLLAGLTFVAASWPWWLFNLQTNWSTLDYFFGEKGRKEPALNVLNHYATVSWPLATGATNYWFLTSRAVGLFLGAIFLLTIAGWAGVRWRGLAGWLSLSLKPSRPVDMLILMALAAPFIYLAWGAGNVAVGTKLDTTGRYLLPLMGVLPVLLAGGLAKLGTELPLRVRGWRWPEYRKLVLGRGVACFIVLAVIGANLFSYRHADFVTIAQSPYFPELRPPPDNGPLISYLKSQNIEYATCNHWVGNRLILDSAEAIKCVDYHDLTVGGIDKFARYTPVLLRPGQRLAFIILNLEDGAASLERKLKELGVTYTRQDFLPYLVIIPTSRPVSPPEVVEQLRYPL